MVMRLDRLKEETEMEIKMRSGSSTFLGVIKRPQINTFLPNLRGLSRFPEKFRHEAESLMHMLPSKNQQGGTERR